MMRGHRVLPLLFLTACSSASRSTVPAAEVAPSPEAPRAPEPPTEPPTVESAEVAEAAPEAAECASTFDCTIVRDACYRPYGVPLTRTEVPAAPDVCPPATYAPVEPLCRDSRCEAVAAYRPDLRACQADRECVVIDTPCGDWFAVRRGHQAAARQQLGADIEAFGCPIGGRGPRPRPRPACLADVCVTRAP